jgi:predicted TIM-barrel fold metal-dependent hydrolase
MRRIVFLLVAVLGLEIASAQQLAPPIPIAESSPQATQPLSPLEMRALALLEPIDAHTHVARGDPSFYAMLERLHMHILDILLVDDHDPYRKTLQQQLQDALRVVSESHGHAALCTSFDPFQFGQPDFAASAIRELDRNFADGAVAVKIWKNIGMELKDGNGHYVMPDNPAFEQIFKDIESHKRTLIAHVAEPDEAWLPPDSKGLDSSYYAQNPVWYMYRHPEAPKKEQILAARDHLLQQHPRLRVVGAHLGSMEDNLAQLGEHLDRYSNFAVDTAARVPHLVVQPSDKVRAFILKYQDRILYATDLEFLKDETPQDAIKEWEGQYAMDWRYFATNDVLDYSGHRVQGLALPKAVLRKLYHANAERWIPDILSEK